MNNIHSNKNNEVGLEQHTKIYTKFLNMKIHFDSSEATLRN